MDRRPLLVLSVLVLVACEPRLEIEELLGPEPEDNTFPALLPLGQVPTPSPAPIEESEKENAALEARADALRRRADQTR
ncbi:MAG: hypothetical protein AAGK37_08025 [Pseudomonadota bacterium]